MDRNTISLIGVLSALQHVLDNDTLAPKTKELRATSKRLESIRKQLLTESLNHGRIVGAARDSISEISAQLKGHFTGQTGMAWTISGLQAVNFRDIDPPPPPSSSSNGPKAISPEILQLARSLMDLSSPQPDASAPSNGHNRVSKHLLKKLN